MSSAQEDTPDPAAEVAAGEKEKAEQEALPYKWTQTIKDVDVSFTVPGNYKGKDLVVEIKKNKLIAGVKGQDSIISVRATYLPSGLNSDQIRFCDGVVSTGYRQHQTSGQRWLRLAMRD